MNSGAQSALVPRLTFFALSSLLAIACGSFAIWYSGSGAVMALGNLGGWGIGLLIAIAILAVPRIPGVTEIFLAATIVALAATFSDSGLSDVHRWISIRPVSVNVAALFLPAFVAILGTQKTPILLAALAWLAAMSLLVAQPDASQATALAIACPLLFAHWPPKWRWPLLMVTAAMAAISWVRPDPLQAVAEVEGIISLMWQISSALAAVGLAALAATIIAVRRAGASSTAFATYCAIVSLMPAFGHFPVPLVGAGISFPLGWWLGFAVMLRSLKYAQARA